MLVTLSNIVPTDYDKFDWALASSVFGADHFGR